MKMTAAVLEKCKQPLQLIELEIPPLQRGQVLVKIAYSAICRSQLMEIGGYRGPDKWLPHLLGHEASGTVVDVGADVTKVAPGDSVILTWIKSSGIESVTPQYSHDGRTINAGPVTTFSNYSIVSENRVVLKPQGLDMDVAVLFGCALATGSGMVLNEIDISSNDVVVVLGLGGIGMAALIALLAQGLTKVLAVDTDSEKCQLAASFGAQTLQCTSDSSLLSQLQELYPLGVDYCIEAGGSIKSIELGFSLINEQSGTLLFASHPPANEKLSIDPHALIKGKKIYGSWGGGLNPDADIPRLSNLFLSSNFPLKRLTRDIYSLEDINTAISHFTQKKIFRPILVVDKMDKH
jgi:S-(hydroxymethyl)glutathione dehydrogenase / alcohol dehydrogenase